VQGLLIDLTGKVAIVTGSGRGIGRAIALALAQSGADIILNDVDLPSIVKVSEEVRALGRTGAPLAGNVSLKAEVDEVVKRSLDRFRNIDILVNNAGTIVRKPAEDFTEDDWDRVINVNLKGVFNFCHAISKHMIARRYGKIINIASIMGEVALPPRASYCASKGGVIAVTKDLAAEWAKYGISVNSISPGWTITELTGKYFAQEDVRKFLLERIPMNRFARPNEIADLAVFLASDKASYITGQNFCVDGGWTSQ
jgi:NAD(P)-dependent dehydrogenase (short-subunit alcohol dehydrogenase family)